MPPTSWCIVQGILDYGLVSVIRWVDMGARSLQVEKYRHDDLRCDVRPPISLYVH
jgi:hypothetical protein